MTSRITRSEAAKAAPSLSCASTVTVAAEGWCSNQELPGAADGRSQVSQFDLRLPRVSSSA